MSSSSVITKEEIQQVGSLLKNTFITESELNLRELEVSKKSFVSDHSIEVQELSKRDRSQSSQDLIKDEHKPLQRPRESLPNHIVEDEEEEAPSTRRWTKLQDNALRESVRVHGEKNWKAIAELVPGRNHAQCLQRWRKVLKPGLVKGHWSFEEDQMLQYLVTQGCHLWGQIAERIPGRTPKQCRERWKNHLDPCINKGPYTTEEDQVILQAQSKLGNKWSQIAQLLQGRTEDSVKIRWKSLQQNPLKAQKKSARESTREYKLPHSVSNMNQIDLTPIKTETNYDGLYPLPYPTSFNVASYPPPTELRIGGIPWTPSNQEYEPVPYWNPYGASTEPIPLNPPPQYHVST